MRIGFGYDSHRFDASRTLMLGGVRIDGAPGLAGHSDGDALLHAITDALLGAAALGDIGSHFPDTDGRWRGADSAALLSSAAREVATAGFSVSNIDATVICERVRIRPHADAMRTRIAEILGLAPSQVSVKGKTDEGLDAVGRGDAIRVHCVALLTTNHQPPTTNH